MKAFDMHDDMGTNLYHRFLNGEKDVFKKYHLDDLKKGEVEGVFCACFFRGDESYADMQKMILHANEVLDTEETTVKVTKKEDLDIPNKIHAVISVEGMCGIGENVEEEIDWLYEHNVKVASLVWNESNQLADGWPNNPLRGLSDKGIKAVEKLNEHNIVIDVSHINEAGFWDIVRLSDKPVIATHSNARSLCNHQRNLTDQQIRAIALKGGLIGLNAARHFISEDEDSCNAATLAKHGRYIADLVGVEHLAFGFDYMNFLGGYGADSMADDLKSAADTQNLVKALKAENFSDEEIEMIAYGNVENLLKKFL